jgi:hypothetical protein
MAASLWNLIFRRRKAYMKLSSNQTCPAIGLNYVTIMYELRYQLLATLWTPRARWGCWGQPLHHRGLGRQRNPSLCLAGTCRTMNVSLEPLAQLNKLLRVWVPFVETNILRRQQPIVPKESLRAPRNQCVTLDIRACRVSEYIGGKATISHWPITSLTIARMDLSPNV